MVDESAFGVTPEQVSAYVDALTALRERHGLTREQAFAVTLGYATSESHELGHTEAEHRDMSNACTEEEWSTPNAGGIQASETVPQIRSDQDLRQLVNVVGPLVPPTQGWMLFVFNYGDSADDGKRTAYVGSVERSLAGRILEAVLDFWRVRDGLLIEPSHHTVGLLRMMVEDIGEHETVGVERHPNQRTSLENTDGGEATVHLEAAAQHLAIYRRLGLKAREADRAKARRKAH